MHGGSKKKVPFSIGANYSGSKSRQVKFIENVWKT
jgi:hypothetical protein